MSINRRAIPLAITMALLCLTGCGFKIPMSHHVGGDEVIHHANAELEGDRLVTVGPRLMIESMASQILANAPQLELIDPLLFRDTAFPEGGWHLQELLRTENRTKVLQQLHVDYLVLVTPPVYTFGEALGTNLHFVMGNSREHTLNMSAAVYEVKSGAAVCRLDLATKAKSRFGAVFPVGVYTEPRMAMAAQDTLAKEIAKAISTASAKPNIRIAVLAVESLYP